jgi:hypothetical protein
LRVMKILPSIRCSPGISSDFPREVMIPIDQGGGGYSCHRSRFPLRKMTLFATNLAIFLLLGVLFPHIAFAGNPRGTLVHDETIRVAPANDAAKLGQAERGHELVILDSSRDWTHVEAILVEPKKDADTEEEAEGKIITGWVPSRALVEMSNPNGDKIIFGEAADSEDQASRRLGRRNAAQDAMRLYYRIYDLFPNSPLAAEGLYRSADIRWQIERTDVMTRPCVRRSMSNG